MCGIAGIFKIGGDIVQQSVSDRIELMLDAMKWRGPDARGTWSDARRVSLGHVRLSIIDLSNSANQPMVDDKGRVVIFNGEIYNYLEIREELKGCFEFRTQSDTEVILAAYDRWGDDCVKHFNGDWAFAIYDPSRRRLFISRDRFGIKPLYYYQGNGELIFGSEVRTLLAGGVPRNVRQGRIMEFLRYRRNETPVDTIVDGVRPVRPGSSLIVDDDGLVTEKIHYGADNLFGASVPEAFDDAADRFGELFEDAVKIRLRADVPVGVCLSGGMDSSAITAAASNYGATEVNTYSAVFPGFLADESSYSNSVAEKCNTRHHVIKPSLKDFYNTYESFIEAQDSPHASPRTLARQLVLKCASEDVTVVLDGQGGDEIFGGYAKCYQIYRRHHEKQAGVKLLMETPFKKKQTGAIVRFAELGSAFDGISRDVSRYVDELDSCEDPYVDRQYVILRNSMLSLLHTEDRLTMYNSIEGRVPLLDHRLVELCFSSPVSFKMREYDKRMMRTWAERKGYLPVDIIRRVDKKGFSTSFEELLQTELEAGIWLRNMLEEYIAETPGIFNMKIIDLLLEDMDENCSDNLNRILSALSVLVYLRKNKLSLID